MAHLELPGDCASLVDWNAGRLLPAPRQSRPTRREMMYPVLCANPHCRSVRWLPRSAAEKAQAEARVCRRCQTVEAGKRGYAATAAAYGVDFALKAVQAEQLHNPSRHEQI